MKSERVHQCHVPPDMNQMDSLIYSFKNKKDTYWENTNQDMGYHVTKKQAMIYLARRKWFRIIACSIT